MKVVELMTRSPVTVKTNQSLADVRMLFESCHFHHVLVVDADETLVGVISDRDVLRHLSPNVGTAYATDLDKAVLNTRVHKIMTRELVTLNLNQDILDVMHAFIDHGVSCLPVIDIENKPLGIISWRDVLKAMMTALE